MRIDDVKIGGVYYLHYTLQPQNFDTVTVADIQPATYHPVGGTLRKPDGTEIIRRFTKNDVRLFRLMPPSAA